MGSRLSDVRFREELSFPQLRLRFACFVGGYPYSGLQPSTRLSDVRFREELSFPQVRLRFAWFVGGVSILGLAALDGC